MILRQGTDLAYPTPGLDVTQPPAFQPAPTHAADAMTRGRNRLRILVVSAAPVGEEMPLDLRREWLHLQAAAREGALPAALFRLLPPTREALQSALQGCAQRDVAPHVLHFAGHGTPGQLAFEDRLCRHAPLDREALALCLRGSGVRLMILNACHTATRETVSLARYLVEKGYVDAAIGHERPVPDRSAAVFAAHLYRGLCRGQRALRAFAGAEGALAAVDPAAARAAQIFGDTEIDLGGLGLPETTAPLIFDGLSGRGGVPEVTRFFGRAEEIIRIGEMLEEPNLRAIAVAGVGGIGKTTLVQELASRHAWRFPGGMALATLRSFGQRTAEDLVRSAATALGVHDAGGAQLEQRLQDHLKQQPGLLIFDNLEDLPEEELERLLHVLGRLPLNGSKALLTLRPAPEVLHEHPWLRLVVLTRGLSDRAGAAYVVRVVEGRVQELVAAAQDEAGVFQGLPLALTRALGGHPKMLDIAVGMAARRGLPALRREVPELEGPAREATAARELAAEVVEARMEKLLASSLALLDDDGRWVLSLLPMFPDASFTEEELTAAVTVALEVKRDDEAGMAAVARRVRAGLDGCAGAGLVEWDTQVGVHRLHPTVQAYIAKHSKLDDDIAKRFLMGLLAQAVDYVAIRHEEHAALDARLTHLISLFEIAWGLSGLPHSARRDVAISVQTMGRFFLQRGHWQIMDHWRGRLAKVGDGSPAARAHRLHHEAMLLSNQGRHNEARALLRESIQILDGLDDRHGRAAALHQLATIEEGQGNYADARSLLRESIQILNKIDDQHARAASLHQFAIINQREGNYTAARSIFQHAIQIEDQIGERLGRAASLHQLAIIEANQGNYADARSLLLESIQIDSEIGNLKDRAISLHLLGVAECRQGNFSSARSLLVEALEILDKIGGRQGRAAPLHQLAIIEQHQGNLDKAHLLVSEAIQIEVEFGNRHGLAASLHVLGSIEFYRDNNTNARTHLRESINIMNEIGDRQGRAASLIMLGQVESIEGQMDEGRKLVREAVQILEEVGAGDLNRARKILDTLEQGTRNSPVETALACSHQALESGRLQEAAQHAEEAVLQARDANNGPGEAAALFLLGQALLGENQPGEAAACFERSGRLLEKHGTTEEARVVKQALTLARAQAGGDVAASEVDAADTPALAAGLLRAGKADKALELVRRALTALADAPEALARARAFEAQALLALGRGEEALTAMEEGISTAADAGLDQLVGQLRGLRDQIRSVTQMQTIAATPVEVLEQRASGPAELSRLLLQKALTLAKNDPAAARDLLARARAAADASGDPRVRVAGLLNAAQILGALDDTDSARQALREALPLARLHLRDALGPIEALAQELGVSLD